MKLLKTFNEENVSPEEASTYKHRIATRGVIFDSDGHIALLHVTKFGYYEIPGGGG